MNWGRLGTGILLSSVLMAGAMPARTAPAPQKRVAIITDSWYPRSHADVIGLRLLQGYKMGDRHYASPVTIASVYAQAPRATDRTRVLASQHGFRVATSVADALLIDSGTGSPRLAVDGVLVLTREELPAGPSPTRRAQLVAEILAILDKTGARIPIFIDKMLAANWQDSQEIVRAARRSNIPLMAGSVLAFAPPDRLVRIGRPRVAVVAASTPYGAFALHAAELLQRYMEQRTTQETGISSIQEVGRDYWSHPDRDGWGGKTLDALLASARTLRSDRPRAFPPPGAEPRVLLLQYTDGTRGVLALIPRVFDDREFLLGAELADGTTTLGGIALEGDPFDHFGYLVHALVEFFTTGQAPAPVERTLLTTGLILTGAELTRGPVGLPTPFLRISYAPPMPAQPRSR